jgi:hypothetical protein
MLRLRVIFKELKVEVCDATKRLAAMQPGSKKYTLNKRHINNFPETNDY